MSSCPTQLFIRYFNTVPPNQSALGLVHVTIFLKNISRQLAGSNFMRSQYLSLLYFNGEKTKDISHIRVSSMFVLQNVTVFYSNKQTTSGLFQVCEVSTKILKVLHAILVSAILFTERRLVIFIAVYITDQSHQLQHLGNVCIVLLHVLTQNTLNIHQKNRESLATIPISWYISITTGRIVNL